MKTVSRRRATRTKTEKGMASLEVVLVLPVIFLVFGVVVVMAHVHLARLRVEGASALAAFTYSTQRGLGKTGAEADAEARRRIEASYFAAADVVSVTTTTGLPTGGNPLSSKIQNDQELQDEARQERDEAADAADTADTIGSALQGDMSGVLGDALGGVAELMADAVLPFGDSRQTTTVKVRVEPFMLRGLFPAKEVSSTLVMDSTPWTFDEWGIMGQYLNKLGVAGDVLAALFFPTGLVGEVGCYGGDT